MSYPQFGYPYSSAPQVSYLLRLSTEYSVRFHHYWFLHWLNVDHVIHFQQERRQHCIFNALYRNCIMLPWRARDTCSLNGNGKEGNQDQAQSDLSWSDFCQIITSERVPCFSSDIPHADLFCGRAVLLCRGLDRKPNWCLFGNHP